MSTNELSIIQKSYDLIKWYVPILNRLPRSHRFILGDRMIGGLYELLEKLLEARFSSEKLDKLHSGSGSSGSDELATKTNRTFGFFDP